MFVVIARQGADAVITEKFFFVEHFGQDAAQLPFIGDGGQEPAPLPKGEGSKGRRCLGLL